jgi:hypothetical protein
MMLASTVRTLVINRRTEIFNQFQDEIVEQITKSIHVNPEKNMIRLDIDGLVSIWPVRMEPQLTVEQRAVIEELFEVFDYGAQLVPDGETFIPLGLRKKDGSGPEYSRYLIEIAW